LEFRVSETASGEQDKSSDPMLTPVIQVILKLVRGVDDLSGRDLLIPFALAGYARVSVFLRGEYVHAPLGLSAWPIDFSGGYSIFAFEQVATK
jgi:hypothetical protein